MPAKSFPDPSNAHGSRIKKCPACGHPVQIFRNPLPTVDVIIEISGGIILIKRKNPPQGWALPGGFVDYGESLEEAVRREAMEETGLELEDLRQLHTYSDPGRDPRRHTISTVFAATATGSPKAGDDAAAVKIFPVEKIPPLTFDHSRIIDDYLRQHR